MEEIDLEEYTILDLATKRIPSTWENLFSESYYELETISRYVLREEEKGGYKSYPLRADIFKAFELCPLDNIKVVILGQDPYHSTIKIDDQQLPTAMGLSFSARPEDKIPPSLKNIFLELKNTIPDFIPPNNGDLTYWAKQGILLLNTVLTVKPGFAESHKIGVWEPFIKRVFTEIARVNPQCVFMLWGNKAQKLAPLIGSKSYILTSGHPSPLSVKYFLGKNHFNLCNRYLIKTGKTPIDWQIPDVTE